jgi:uncharacterized membrane protein
MDYNGVMVIQSFVKRHKCDIMTNKSRNVLWLVFKMCDSCGGEYIGVLISLWLFLFAAQPKESSLDGLKKIEQRSHKCVQLREEYVE